MQEELKKASENFFKLTGLKLDIDSISEYDKINTLEKINMATNAYKEKFSAEYVLKLAMKGQLETVELDRYCKRFRITPNKKRQLFSIKAKQNSSNVISEILYGIFPFGSKNIIVKIDDDEFALIYEIKDNTTNSEYIANLIVDSLAMEAMVQVHISYSKTFLNINEIDKAYNSCKLSLNIGMIFYSDKAIIPFDKLGVGGLIYNLPINVCENFLHELFKADYNLIADTEMQNTVNTFLENNLNIAETARKLHMHRNTLVYRIEQLEKILGIEIKTIDGAITFRIATMVVNYLNFIKEIGHE